MDTTKILEMLTNKLRNKKFEEEIPPILIDSKFLEEAIEVKLHRNKGNKRKLYEIDGTLFQERELVDNLMKYNDLEEFEIKEVSRNDDKCILKGNDNLNAVAEVKSEKNVDLCPGQSDPSKLKDNSKHVSIQNTPYGIVINSNVLLSVNEWNTIVVGDDSNCVVCGINFKTEDISNHIATEEHKRCLDECKPLTKFDCVVRQINDKYYCALCNLNFDVIDMGHKESQPHGQKLLASINRVSDIMNDLTTYNKSSNSNTEDNENKSEFKYNDCIYFNVNNRSRANSDSVDTDKFYDFFEDTSYNYEDSNSDQENIESDSTNGNSEAPLFSYADIAKKPKTYTPNFVEIKLGDKVATVHFYFWHMIAIQKKNNCFYCMACNGHVGPIRYKLEHCVTVAHVENLMKCTIVGYFKDYVVRKMPEKFYHCGHCNNLLLTHQMENHIEMAYMKKGVIPKMNWITNDTIVTKNETERSSSISPKSNDSCKKNVGNKTTEVVDKTVPKHSDDSQTASLYSTIVNANLTEKSERNKIGFNNPMTPYIGNTNSIDRQEVRPSNTTNIPSIADTIVIRVFGRTFNVALLSVNFIHKQPNDYYYCLFCQMLYKGEIIWQHIFNDSGHRWGITQQPFCPQYDVNLIRNTPHGWHCIFCNIYMKFDPIQHFGEPMHQLLLKSALGIPQYSTNDPYLGVPISYYNTNPKNPTNLPSQNTETRTSTPQSDVKTDQSEQSDVISEQLGPSTKKRNNKNIVATNNDSKNTNNKSRNRDKKDKVNKIIDANRSCDNFKDNVVKSDVNHDIKDKKVHKNKNSFEQKVEPDNEKVHTVEDENVTHKKINPTNKVLDVEKLTDNSSIIESNKTFDVEEFVYVKVKNAYAKITATAYNTFVPTGKGSRYCFVCAKEVLHKDLTEHFNTEIHQRNMLDNKFLANLQKHFLRQISTFYHCALCNVLIFNTYLQDHLKWATHTENLPRKIGKNIRRSEIKSGIKEFECLTQNEDNISTTDNINPWTVKCNVRFVTHEDVKKIKNKKIIKTNDTALKISWDAYHGIIKAKKGNKCLICQSEFKSYELDSHIETQCHVESLDKGFRLDLAPNLIRMITSELMHCLTCNIRLYSTPHVMKSHLNSEKHKRLHEEATVSDISTIESVQTDILTLS